MAYTYQVTSVIGLVRALLVAELTTQGEAPTALPLATTAEQVVAMISDLPMTILESKGATVEQEGTSYLFTLGLHIHHVREVEEGGSGIEIAQTRLSGVGAAMLNDYRLLSAGGGAIPIHTAMPGALKTGDDCVIQQLLTQAGQGASLVAVSLATTITWYEG